jgi:predicted Zn-dependent protease
MSVILTEEEAKALLKKVMSYSKSDECEANLLGNIRGNIRYARNEVSTSGALINQNLQVQSAFGKKVGVATIDEFDDASLEKVVRRSEELARLAPENPEYVGLLGPQQYKSHSLGYVEDTANITPDTRAEMVFKSLELARAQKLVAAGFLEDQKGFSAMMNSKGLFAYYKDSGINFSLTVRTEDGTGSGYVTRGTTTLKLDTVAATKIAMQKAVGSKNAKALEPGKYTVILEPTAAAVLLESIYFDMDARSADEGRSFFSKQGGKPK